MRLISSSSYLVSRWRLLTRRAMSSARLGKPVRASLRYSPLSLAISWARCRTGGGEAPGTRPGRRPRGRYRLAGRPVPGVCGSAPPGTEGLLRPHYLEVQRMDYLRTIWQGSASIALFSDWLNTALARHRIPDSPAGRAEKQPCRDQPGKHLSAKPGPALARVAGMKPRSAWTGPPTPRAWERHP